MSDVSEPKVARERVARQMRWLLGVGVALVITVDVAYAMFPDSTLKGAAIGAAAGIPLLVGPYLCQRRDVGTAFLYGFLASLPQWAIVVLIGVTLGRPQVSGSLGDTSGSGGYEVVR